MIHKNNNNPRFLELLVQLKTDTLGDSGPIKEEQAHEGYRRTKLLRFAQDNPSSRKIFRHKTET